MAEVVAAAAGIAGLMPIALQVAEATAALRRFRKSIKDAPETLADIAFEIETLAHALQQISRYTAVDESRDAATASLLSRCIRNCEKTAQRITLITLRIEQLLGRSRAIGRLKIAVSEREIQRMYDDLDRARNTLHLAFSILAE